MLRCKASQLVEVIWPLVKADIPVFIHGKSGIGKSQMIRTELMPLIEREYGPSVLHDFRLSSKDITDGTGIPTVDQSDKSTIWTRPAFIPKDDGKMHVIFLDEIGHASVQMQHAVGYQLVLDRGLGEYKLPRKHRVILALNIREDKGGDNKLAGPFQNRGAHVVLDLDQSGWIEYATQRGIDPRLIAFVKLRPEQLHKMSETSPAWPSPRTIEMLGKVMRENRDDLKSIQNAAQGLCGEGFATEFATFIRDLGAALPKLSDIKANPSRAKVPDDLHHQYVVASAISHHIDKASVDAWVTYLKRLSPDLASMAAHNAMQRDSALSDNKTLKALVMN